MNNKKYIFKTIDTIMASYNDTYKKFASLSPGTRKDFSHLTICIVDSDFQVVKRDDIRVIYDYSFSLSDITKHLTQYNCEVTITPRHIASPVLSIREIRQITGLSQQHFAYMYNIPTSTLQKWEASSDSTNHRECPLYVREILEKVVREDWEKKENGNV